ncbi:MAG TPA: glycosyltransferase, partial [Acidobacteriota bacterium]|nr:glycosyltransferase [Acidobacteriota bacterium]
MRILHLIPKLSAGGAERQLSYLASELARGGHEVHIGYSREGPERPDLIGVVLHRLESRSNYSPLLLRQLVRLIRSVKPDVVQTWILQMDILGG